MKATVLVTMKGEPVTEAETARNAIEWLNMHGDDGDTTPEAVDPEHGIWRFEIDGARYGQDVPNLRSFPLESDGHYAVWNARD